MLGAIDLNIIHDLPPHESGDDSRQAQDMIQVAMRQEYLIQPFKTCPRPQDLALRTFTAIHQKAIILMLHNQGGKPPVHRWRGRRST